MKRIESIEEADLNRMFIGKIAYHQTYNGTIQHYKKYGLKCIILWSRDVLREDNENFIIQKLKSEGGI